MIAVGQYSELRILRETSVGLYLGDDAGEDVLLPNKYCPKKFTLDEKITVFVYRDHEDRKVATNITPKILLNKFAFLRVTDASYVGAFMDWGMEKELLVPNNEQRQKMEVDRWYIVYLMLDSETDRLYASNKIEKHLDNETLTVSEGDAVELLVMQKTDLGYSVIVNNLHKGLVFENEIFKTLNIGDKLPGYVKKIREDNKLDISLQPIGYENFIDSNSQEVFEVLKRNNGFMSVSDKSSPEDIYAKFGMSKKVFKKAIGSLYKEKKIFISPEGIKIV